MPNDQLSAYYPGGGQYPLVTGDAEGVVSASGREVEYHCRSVETPNQPRLDVVYRLVDGEPWLHVESTYTNPHAEAITVTLQDAIRADRSFQFTFVPEANLFTAEDDWWHQSYAVVSEGRQPAAIADSVDKGRPLLAWQQEGTAALRLEPGESYTLGSRSDSGGQHAAVARVAATPRGSEPARRGDLRARCRRPGGQRTPAAV